VVCDVTAEPTELVKQLEDCQVFTLYSMSEFTSGIFRMVQGAIKDLNYIRTIKIRYPPSV